MCPRAPPMWYPYHGTVDNWTMDSTTSIRAKAGNRSWYWHNRGQRGPGRIKIDAGGSHGWRPLLFESGRSKIIFCELERNLTFGSSEAISHLSQVPRPPSYDSCHMRQLLFSHPLAQSRSSWQGRLPQPIYTEIIGERVYIYIYIWKKRVSRCWSKSIIIA